MNTERRHEVQKALDALDARRSDLLDKLRVLRPQMIEYRDRLLLVRAERKILLSRIGPNYHLPDKVWSVLRQAVDDFDTRINEFINILGCVDSKTQQIHNDVRVVSEEHNRLASLIAPIQFLPDELLAEIWNRVRAPQRHPDYCGIPFPYIASWVSSRWRSVAIGTAGLWRDIYISPYRSLRFIETQLERSRVCSLDVWVTGDSGRGRTIRTAGLLGYRDRQRRMEELITLAATCVHRWRSMELYGSGAEYLAIILPPLRDAQVPQLKNLYLRFPTTPYMEPLFTGGAPNLFNVEFHGMSIPTNLTLFRGLRHLDLRDIPAEGRASYTEFQDLLAACPLLSFLSFYGRCFDSDSSEDHQEPICLPALLSLTLSFNEPEDDFICDVFDVLSAPGLTTLELVDFGFEAFVAFLNVMTDTSPSSRFPLLSTLSLYNDNEENTALAYYSLPLLDRFPHIDNLRLRVAIELYEILTTLVSYFAEDEFVDNPEPICPRLSTLTWHVWTLREELVMLSFIKLRAEMGFPIARLLVDPGYFTDVSLATQEMFSAIVHVQLDDDL